ncbi:VOC family protein [Stackebrandtia nassauensis]|uniref:VOC family protein n=1 Tax=Stackebrandtia nassauensis TaxID=283811 RepID=UPI0001A397B7|nr:VOC family protein [Stackebrandtia nassauensis]
MASRWNSTVIDARDPKRLARWWAEVLDYRVVFETTDMTFIADHTYPKLIVTDTTRAFETPPVGPGLLFISVGAEKHAKNRVHLDINPEDQDAEVERLVDMGARHVDVGHGDRHWVVLADPEGNEFCVMKPIEVPGDLTQAASHVVDGRGHHERLALGFVGAAVLEGLLLQVQ